MSERTIHLEIHVPGSPTEAPIGVFLPISKVKAVLQARIKANRRAMLEPQTGEELLALGSDLDRNLRALAHVMETPINEIDMPEIDARALDMADRILDPERSFDAEEVVVPDFLPTEEERLGDIADGAVQRAEAGSLEPFDAPDEPGVERMVNYLGALYRAGRKILDKGWARGKNDLEAALLLPPDLEAAIEAQGSEAEQEQPVVVPLCRCGHAKHYHDLHGAGCQFGLCRCTAYVAPSSESPSERIDRRLRDRATGVSDYGELPPLPFAITDELDSPILIDHREWVEIRSFDTQTRAWVKAVLAATLELDGNVNGIQLAGQVMSNETKRLLEVARDSSEPMSKIKEAAARVARVALNIYRKADEQ